jgi:hypothetical protein
MVVFNYSSSNEDFDIEEKEDKRPKHGGYVFSREYIRKNEGRCRQQAYAHDETSE